MLHLRVITAVIPLMLFTILFCSIQSNIYAGDDIEIMVELPPVMNPAGVTDSITISPSEPIVIEADSQIQFSATWLEFNDELFLLSISKRPFSIMYVSGGLALQQCLNK